MIAYCSYLQLASADEFGDEDSEAHDDRFKSDHEENEEDDVMEDSVDDEVR